jgi:hypothetical protein
MTRTATRVAAAVGATVVMMGLATPALACTKTDAGGRSSAVSFEQAKNDPSKAGLFGKHDPSLTLADAQAKLDEKAAQKLAWLDAIEAKVAASDKLTDEQKTFFLSHLQAKEDALTQLRADVAAATTLDELRAVLKAEGAALFGHRHHFRGHHSNRHHGDRHHGGFNRSGNDNRGAGFRGGDHHGHSFHSANFHH